jgi:hypothetical protein
MGRFHQKLEGIKPIGLEGNQSPKNEKINLLNKI